MPAEAGAAPAYMDALNGLLHTGAEGLGEAITRPQVEFVLSCRAPDGGFRGRRGGADTYYTDFALRCLDLLGADPAQIAATADFVAAQPIPRDLVHCFSLLSCARVLRRYGASADLDQPAIANAIGAQQLPSGGFGGADGRISATRSFIAALCHELLGLAMPGAEAAASAVLDLMRPDAGFADGPDEPAGQTNATAAAIGLLAMRGTLGEQVAQQAAAFLVGMQHSGGGLLAYAGAPEPDLLSTFTGLVALAFAADVTGLDLRGVARFVGDLALAQGGFRAASSDRGSDVEYTYYGLGCLALLRVAASRR